MINRCSSGAPEHNTVRVVGAVDEAAAGPFDVFDTGVVRFDFAGVAPVTMRTSIFPQPANGSVEPGRFGLLGILHEVFEVVLGLGGVFQ